MFGNIFLGNPAAEEPERPSSDGDMNLGIQLHSPMLELVSNLESENTNTLDNSENTDINPSNFKIKSSDVDFISIIKLQKDKNFYKEKCFAMENQLMELKMLVANQKLQEDSAAITLDSDTGVEPLVPVDSDNSNVSNTSNRIESANIF